jgi:protein dispatched 3
MHAEMYQILEDGKDGNFKITFGGEVMTDWEIHKTLLMDARYVLISIAIAIVMLAIGTRSIFLTFFGLLQVLISFPISYSLYYLGGHRDLTIIQFLAPFVILGIGLDDIFVFVGIYRSLRLYAHRYSIEKRVAVAWSRATGSMLATSATSGAAFAANVTSPVPAVRAPCTDFTWIPVCQQRSLPATKKNAAECKCCLQRRPT